MLSSMGIDPQGCLDITRRAARRFNRKYTAPDDIPCISIAGNPTPETVCWPLTRTFAALSELEGPNDGLVPLESALAFGTPLPVWPVDHLRQMNWMERDEMHPALAPPLELYTHLMTHIASLGFGARPGAFDRGAPKGVNGMADLRDWTRRELLKTAAAGGALGGHRSAPASPETPLPPIPSGFVAKTSTRAPATG